MAGCKELTGIGDSKGCQGQGVIRRPVPAMTFPVESSGDQQRTDVIDEPLPRATEKGVQVFGLMPPSRTVGEAGTGP
jgi:hypothetical protein